MNYSYPHQKFIKVNKAPLNNSFLSINKNVWKAASKDLGGTGLILYLYFASNKPDYHFAFSPADVIRETGIGKTSVYKYFDIMIQKGYLVPINGNTYIFNEVPFTETAERTENLNTQNELNFEDSSFDKNGSSEISSESSLSNREIYNKYDIDNIIDKEECPPLVIKHAPFVF